MLSKDQENEIGKNFNWKLTRILCIAVLHLLKLISSWKECLRSSIITLCDYTTELFVHVLQKGYLYKKLALCKKTPSSSVVKPLFYPFEVMHTANDLCRNCRATAQMYDRTMVIKFSSFFVECRYFSIPTFWFTMQVQIHKPYRIIHLFTDRRHSCRRDVLTAYVGIFLFRVVTKQPASQFSFLLAICWCCSL